MDFKYNKKDKLSIDFEMDHLKDHLNASFDKDNFIPSEELIQKTLSAIEKGESAKTPMGDDRKRMKYPAFKMAGAAAAILVLIVGIAYSQGYFPLSRQANNNLNIKALPELKTAKKYAISDSYSAAASATEEGNAADSSARINNDTVTNKGILSDNQTSADNKTLADNQTTAGNQTSADNGTSTDNTISSDKTTSASSEIAVKKATGESVGIFTITGDDVPREPILITDLLPAADQVKEIAITNESKEEILIKNNSEETLKLYDLLGSVTLTTGETLSDNVQYIIKIKTIDDKIYTISINDGIEVVNQSQKDPQTEYYLTNDTDALIKRLEEYVNQLK